MLDTWQELPSDRPTFVVLRSKFDQLLSKQKNVGETYIDLNITSPEMSEELDNCKENSDLTEVSKKLSQHSNPFENVEDEKMKDTVSDSGTDTTRHATNPYVDYPTHSSENLTRPSHLALPSQQPGSSTLQPQTAPALNGHSMGNKSLLSPCSDTLLSTSAPNRHCSSWNASSWTEKTDFL